MCVSTHDCFFQLFYSRKFYESQLNENDKEMPHPRL